MTGATASGKTKTAIQLAKANNAEIICADSRIVYKDLDIVSAKPDEIEQDNVKHHLIDILTVEDDFSAGDFVEYAKKAINDISKRGKNVIISGGTWFYIKSLIDNKKLPECKINKALREELSKLDNKTLWEKLNSLDPKRAKEIHPNNKDKVIRSIEMCIELNMPISEYKRKENEEYDVCYLMLDMDRDILYERINLRVDNMISSGLKEEWERNKEKYPNNQILLSTIGYKEFFEFENENEAIEKIKQHTRNFAKRQLTYFRSNKDIKLIKDFNEASNIAEEFFK